MHFSHKMNVVIYHSHDVLLPFQIYFKGDWFKHIIQVSSLFYIYTYVSIFMHFSHKMKVVIYHSHDVLLPFQIYSKGDWFKWIIQVSSLFFMYFFIVIEHSIRNKTSDTRNTRSLKYGTKQIQAY